MNRRVLAITSSVVVIALLAVACAQPQAAGTPQTVEVTREVTRALDGDR